MTTGDVDNDGDIDIVVAERSGLDSTVARSLLNNGRGQFLRQESTVSIAQNQLDMYLTDFTGDGKLDLLTVGTYIDAITLAVGTGTGVFRGRQVLASGAIRGALINDFNADGFQDVVVSTIDTTSGDSFLQVLLGALDRKFTTALWTRLDEVIYALGSADIDADGNVDLLVLSYGRLQLYRNNGKAEFTKEVESTIQVNPSYATPITGDFNNDGYIDVVTASYSTPTVSLVLGNGTKKMQPAQNIATLTATVHVSTADLDGDGDLDLLATNSRGITQLLFNNGKGDFSSTNNFLVGEQYYRQAFAADFNGDNALDVVTDNSGSGKGANIFFNSVAVLPVKASNATLPITLYPNPAHDHLVLQLPLNTKAATVAVLNALGQQVAALPATRPATDGSITLPIAGIAAGIYVVQVEADKIRTTQRVLIK